MPDIALNGLKTRFLFKFLDTTNVQLSLQIIKQTCDNILELPNYYESLIKVAKADGKKQNEDEEVRHARSSCVWVSTVCT